MCCEPKSHLELDLDLDAALGFKCDLEILRSNVSGNTFRGSGGLPYHKKQYHTCVYGLRLHYVALDPAPTCY